MAVLSYLRLRDRHLQKGFALIGKHYEQTGEIFRPICTKSLGDRVVQRAVTVDSCSGQDELL